MKILLAFCALSFTFASEVTQTAAPVRYAQILAEQLTIRNKADERLEVTVYGTTPQAWPRGNGKLIIGCEGTCSDVTQQARPSPMVLGLYANSNAAARASGNVEKAGDHSHPGCVTLDILSSRRPNHIVFDITQPLVTTITRPLIFDVIYLEKLHPSALYNPERTHQHQNCSVLHLQTFKNCLTLLRPGGGILFDNNYGFAVSSMTFPTLQFMLAEQGRIVALGANSALIFQSVCAGSQGAQLNGDQEIIYNAYYEFASGTLFKLIKSELEELGFCNVRQVIVGKNKSNPFNGRTGNVIMIGAEKPNLLSETAQ